MRRSPQRRDNCAKGVGQITELAVSDNQRVKVGDLIASIDPRDYVAALDQRAPISLSPRRNLQTPKPIWK